MGINLFLLYKGALRELVPDELVSLFKIFMLLVVMCLAGLHQVPGNPNCLLETGIPGGHRTHGDYLLPGVNF